MPRLADVAYFNFRPGHSELWRAGAACGSVASKDPWMGEGREHAHARKIGKAVCNDLCPVREDCLAYALSAGIEHGTWGGMDERERQRLSESQRVRLISARRMMPYDGPATPKESVMVAVKALVRFKSDLPVGSVGQVEDALARPAVKGGMAELVGEPENLEEWLAGGELRLKRRKPSRKMVAATVTDGGE